MTTDISMMVLSRNDLSEQTEDHRIELILEAINNGDRALAAATEIYDMLTIHDRAKAIQYLSRAVRMSRDVQNKAAELTIKAERKLGIYMRQMPKNQGARGNPNGRGAEYYDDTAPTYEELEIDYRSASRWQSIANLPEARLTEFLHETMEAGRELTCGGVYRFAKNWRDKHNGGSEQPQSVRGYLGLERAVEQLYRGQLTINNFLQVAAILRAAIRHNGEITISIDRIE